MQDDVHSLMVQALLRALAAGRLTEPFRARQARQAVPQFGLALWGTFLPKHEKDARNRWIKYFVRVERGLYRIWRRQS